MKEDNRCSKYEFQKLFIPQHVQGEAVGRPAAIEGRFGLAVQKRVMTGINRHLCVH